MKSILPSTTRRRSNACNQPLGGGHATQGRRTENYKSLSGKADRWQTLWLSGYETTGAIELETGTPVVAVKIFPVAGDPEFTEPIVIMLALENLENFIKAIRIAEAGFHSDAHNGGRA
jgi:hypothetical protein